MPQWSILRAVLILLALYSIASDNEKLIKMLYKQRLTNRHASMCHALVEVGGNEVGRG